MTTDVITLVSGLPRSGTSLMMRMLEVGGLPILSDGLREADQDNLNGYYELEEVKTTQSNQDWLREAPGRAVKVIHHFLEFLPTDRHYRILFMRRHLSEIIASQKEMLIRRGTVDEAMSDREMTVILRQEILRVMHWLKDRPGFDVLYVNYNDLMAKPEPVLEAIKDFLGPDLNYAAMRGVINPGHYRQRGAAISPFRRGP